MSEPVIVLAVTFVALFVSSIAGYGGSLVLVPALAAVIGPKEGVALAALLLGWNNVFKVVAYRRTLALRQGWPLLAVTAIGVWVGARLLIESSDRTIVWAIVIVTVASLVLELTVDEARLRTRRHVAVPAMAGASVLSGISGSSGPLKGVAIRALSLPRLEHVGVAATVSLVADALKVELFAEAGILPRRAPAHAAGGPPDDATGGVDRTMDQPSNVRGRVPLGLLDGRRRVHAAHGRLLVLTGRRITAVRGRHDVRFGAWRANPGPGAITSTGAAPVPSRVPRPCGAARTTRTRRPPRASQCTGRHAPTRRLRPRLPR